MGVLELNENTGDRMDAIIREFINGNERMLANSRYFLPKELGGYGVVSMDTLDMCIKANWIRRWMNNIFERDYAECICLQGEYQEPDMVNIRGRPLKDNVCSNIIMHRWAKYKSMFYEVGKNSHEASCFGAEFYYNNGRAQTTKIFDIERPKRNG